MFKQFEAPAIKLRSIDDRNVPSRPLEPPSDSEPPPFLDIPTLKPAERAGRDDPIPVDNAYLQAQNVLEADGARIDRIRNRTMTGPIIFISYHRVKEGKLDASGKTFARAARHSRPATQRPPFLMGT